MPGEEARQQAEAERLTLLVADNKTGYFGVTLQKPGQPKPHEARVWRGGKTVSLGTFATAEEAALCVARSPEGKAAAQRAAAVPVPLTSEEARQQAQAERLTLRVAENKTGYFGVNYQPGKPKPYKAQVTRGGKSAALGSFATAEEAALCVARSPEGKAAAERDAVRRAKREREVCHEQRSTDCAEPYVSEPVPWRCRVVDLAYGPAGDDGVRADAALKSNFAEWRRPATLNGGFYFCLLYPEDTLAACVRVRWDAPLRFWELGESYSSIVGGSSMLLQELVRYLWAVPAAKNCSIKAIAAGESAIRRYVNFVRFAPGTENGMRFVAEKEDSDDDDDDDDDVNSDDDDDDAEDAVAEFVARAAEEAGEAASTPAAVVFTMDWPREI